MTCCLDAKHISLLWVHVLLVIHLLLFDIPLLLLQLQLKAGNMEGKSKLNATTGNKSVKLYRIRVVMQIRCLLVPLAVCYRTSLIWRKQFQMIIHGH